MTLETISEQKAFGGLQGVYKHASKSTGCQMEFSLFMPSRSKAHPVPVLYYLSGLTCTQENATTKAGFQRIAEQLNIAVVCPDTSPRGLGYEGEDDSYDFGTGAGFYLDAVQEPWSSGYQMYTYCTEELPAVIDSHFNVDIANAAITGHSMGGHGALTIALKNPDKYKSVSAFAPIVAPTQVPWGINALEKYLGPDTENWRTYDATELVNNGHKFNGEILIDQGDADPFYQEQLKPELFVQACKEQGQKINLRIQEGYDHSYYLMATFIEDHLRHHASYLYT
ncbi:S-formylglutathione hydrolase [Sneathiella glossodoripedis]|uniref:S-formylglutathione hydrolase n=1 Tax=Sneathiella glossodoripedis TaxID=418853 RepID=UPI000470A09E|nr:S-formylglutathione hydrolase [Sneathiella glossodoripedis]